MHWQCQTLHTFFSLHAFYTFNVTQLNVERLRDMSSGQWGREAALGRVHFAAKRQAQRTLCFLWHVLFWPPKISIRCVLTHQGTSPPLFIGRKSKRTHPNVSRSSFTSYPLRETASLGRQDRCTTINLPFSGKHHILYVNFFHSKVPPHCFCTSKNQPI
jgi:hypothetical protein